MTDIVQRLNDHCVGHPYSKIEWPHRLLHDARDEIERLRARKESAMSDSASSNISLVDRLRNLADALAHGSGKTVEISYADIDLAANEIEFLERRLSEVLANSPADRESK